MEQMTNYQLDQLAKVYLNIKEMSFIQFIDAVQSGRIHITQDMSQRIFVAPEPHQLQQLS